MPANPRLDDYPTRGSRSIQHPRDAAPPPPTGKRISSPVGPTAGWPWWAKAVLIVAVAGLCGAPWVVLVLTSR